MVNLNPVLISLNVLGSNGLTILSAFAVILALQSVFIDQNSYNKDYLTQNTPTYKPYPTASWYSFYKYNLRVSDNACMRTAYYDPKNANLSRLEFDYIIVGSGPGGSVVANRLSEDPSVTVLLVEAGQDPVVDSTVPQFFPFMLGNSRAFNYTSEVVNGSSNAYRNGSPLTGGMMLGGSSGTNAMIYVCGTDKDYDTWSALGNTGWDYNSLLPFFKKLEGNTDAGTVLYKEGQYHGTDGPLTVSKYGSTDPFIQVLKDAFNQTGYKFNKDWNSKEYNGLVEVQGTIKGGERMSAARAFLIPLKTRSNFKVMKGSFVEKVLFSGKKATGVKIFTKQSDCPEITVHARKEVIISAGAMGTPKILLKSGIGRAADLTPFGIPQVGNLAVGENYQDHPKTVHFIKINPNVPKQTTLDIIVDASQYLIDRTGKFSNLNVMNYNAFINTTDPNATYPDAHYIFYRFEKSQEFIQDILWRLGFKQQFIDELIAINKDYQILMVFNHLPNPIAKGTVKLRSNNVYDYPKAITNWYNNPTDIELTLRGYKKVEDLVATTAFQNSSAELVKFNITECNPLPYPSDDYRKCYMKYFSASGWHQTGTAKMGPVSDVNAVVDPRLLVHGFENLRVADASIMPNVITVNTQCPTYMIGEKAADMIKFDNDPENF